MKQTTGLLLIIVWIYVFLDSADKTKGVRGFLKSAFDPRAVVFTGCFFLISGFWFVKVFQVYGHPLHTPAAGMALSSGGEDVSGWFKIREPAAEPGVFLFIGSNGLMSFVFMRAFHAQKIQTGNPRGMAMAGRPEAPSFFGHGSSCLYSCDSAVACSHRRLQSGAPYFYLAYPPIALLSALVLEPVQAKKSLRLRAGIGLGDVIVVLLLVWNAQIGVSKAMSVIFSNNMLL